MNTFEQPVPLPAESEDVVEARDTLPQFLSKPDHRSKIAQFDHACGVVYRTSAETRREIWNRCLDLVSSGNLDGEEFDDQQVLLQTLADRWRLKITIG